MKIVGIVGSPRHGRNTASLVQKILEGAHSQQVDSTMYYIDDYHINPCNACDECKETGVCVVGDDMQLFYTALNRGRGLVLGTPIYLDHVSAQTKIFIDRLHAYLGPDQEHYFPRNYKAILVVTWGDGNLDLYNDVIDWLQERLRFYFDIQTVAKIKAANLEEYPAERRARLFQEAFYAGVLLANSLIGGGMYAE